MECRDGVRLGISSVQVVGVDELEEGLVIEELGKRVFWVRVGQLITGGLPGTGMVEAREGADRIGYSSPWLLNDDLERKRVLVSDRLFSVRGMTREK